MAEDEPLFDTVALIGLGLIGSSLGRVIKRKKLARRIVGHARSADTRRTAVGIGFVDSAVDNAAAAAAGADLVILCSPVGTYASLSAEMTHVLKPGAIVSDVGSVKASVVRDVGPNIPEGVHFIPAHPIAGTEKSGPKAGFPELFEGRWCILTPADTTDEAHLRKLMAFWEACGSKVAIMSPERHDLVLAITSHVPHLIAFNIVGTAAHLETVTESEVIKYSAGGFRDFTRLAASDPVMWRDVFLNNREAVLEMLARFMEDLTALQRAIRFADGEVLEQHFAETRRIRREIIDAGQDTTAHDFGRQAVREKRSGKKT